MDVISYALSKKIAAHVVSGVQSMSVNGQTLTINTKDSGVLTMTFPTPKDGVSVTDIDVNANNQIVFTMSDGSEFISGKIPTVKGEPGFSPTITENVDNTDKIYKLDITTADSIFTTPNLKGADGQSGTGGDSSVTLTQEEYEALTEEEKLNGLYYIYDTKRIYKNGVQYGASEPIPLTMAEYEALKEAGAIDEQQEYLIEADEQGILISAEDIGYSNTKSGIQATTVQDAIDKIAENGGSGEKNVQSDWNETDDTADGFIKNKPTIPDITGLATETYVDNKVADYTKTVDLADVATSGSYNDLTDKPTIPSLDGYAKTSEIPSKVSELENDSNYLSSIPEEYVTETELEAKGYLTEHQDISSKVDKVEGKSLISDTEIARLASVDNYDDTAIKAEIAKKADTTSIPSKVSELTNDSNYQTAEQVNSTVTTEIAKVVADAPESLNTLKEMSDWIAGHEEDASAMNSAISDNKTAIASLQTGKADKSEIPTTVAELTDSADYAKTANIPKTLPANGGNSTTVNGHTVNSDVPENAVFTDTVYDDTEVKGSIDELNSNLNSEIRRSKEADEILKSRIDNITSLPEGSTTGDAELHDIRVKADGTIAENAGNAVREQFNELKSDLNNLSEEIDNLPWKNIFDKSSYTLNSLINGAGDVVENGYFLVTDFYPVKGCFKYRGITLVSVNAFACLYDENKNVIQTFSPTTNESIIFVNDNVKFVRFSLANQSNNDDIKTFELFTNICTSNEFIFGDWLGKKFITLGDSITWQDGKAYIQGEHIGEIARGYQTILKEKLGFSDYVNFGISGKPIANGTTNGDGIVVTAQTVSYRSVDLCIISGGTNDFKLNVPIGSIGSIGDTSFDTTTFYGALRFMLEYILKEKPTVRICLFTPLQRDNDGYDVNHINTAGHKLVDYVNAVKCVGKMYGIPVCDMYSNSGITKLTLDTYTLDGLHPNDLGYERMGGYAAHFINSIDI